MLEGTIRVLMKVGRKEETTEFVNKILDIQRLPPPNPEDPATFKYVHKQVQVPNMAYSGFACLDLTEDTPVKKEPPAQAPIRVKQEKPPSKTPSKKKTHVILDLTQSPAPVNNTTTPGAMSTTANRGTSSEEEQSLEHVFPDAPLAAWMGPIELCSRL